MSPSDEDHGQSRIMLNTSYKATSALKAFLNPTVNNKICRFVDQSGHIHAARMQHIKRLAVPALAVVGTAVLGRLVSRSLRGRLRSLTLVNSTSTHLQKLHAATPYGNPLPGLLHRTLTTGNGLKPGRVIIVGDVHGCHEELERLLAQTQFNSKLDNLILVGDLVNKGPNSIEVIRTVLAVGAHAVRGNHDDNCLRKWSTWKETGQLSDKSPWVQDLTQQDAEFLASLPFSLHLPELGVLIVHAGLVPQIHQSVTQPSCQELLEHQKMVDLLCMRDLLPAGSAVEGSENVAHGHSNTSGQHWKATAKPTADSTAWAPLWPGPHHIVFGHDAKRKLQTEGCIYATGLDTGCVYGGALTAAVIPPLETLTQMSPVIAAYATSYAMLSTQDCDINSIPNKRDHHLDKLPPVTRADLHMEIIGVPAARTYVAITQ